MTVLCDFIQIVGDNGQAIPQTAAGAEVPIPDFGTGGRRVFLKTLSAIAIVISYIVFSGSAWADDFTLPGSSCTAWHGDQSSDFIKELGRIANGHATSSRQIICALPVHGTPPRITVTLQAQHASGTLTCTVWAYDETGNPSSTPPWIAGTGTITHTMPPLPKPGGTGTIVDWYVNCTLPARATPNNPADVRLIKVVY